MEAVPKSVGAITLFVEDTQRAKAFYERAFEASAIYEDENSVAFGFENMVVNLLAAREAPGLIGPCAGGERGRGIAVPAHDLGQGRGCGVRDPRGPRGGVVERPGRPSVGYADGELRRSRRPHLGDRGADPRRGLSG